MATMEEIKKNLDTIEKQIEEQVNLGVISKVSELEIEIIQLSNVVKQIEPQVIALNNGLQEAKNIIESLNKKVGAMKSSVKTEEIPTDVAV